MAGVTTVAEFMQEARSMLAGGATDENRDAVGRVLSDACRKPGFIEQSEMRTLHDSQAAFSILQSDTDGLTLMLARFSPDEETPVHDHGSWGIACVVRGRDRYRHYRFKEDGSLEVLFERELDPGSFVTWPDPPHDVHSQQGIVGAAWELVLFGRDVTRIARHYHDLDTGKVRTALPR